MLFKFLFGEGGCTGGMWKFPGQESNPCHSSNNARSLTHCATRKLLTLLLRNEFHQKFSMISRKGMSLLFFPCECFLFFFLWSHPLPVDVPSPGTESKLQLWHVTDAALLDTLTHCTGPGIETVTSQ